MHTMANHPNRSKKTGPSKNPKPEQVKAVREAEGITQEQAGQLLHSGWHTFQKWESGERRMHPTDWELLRVKLNARRMIAAGDITEDQVKALGLYLPALDE